MHPAGGTVSRGGQLEHSGADDEGFIALWKKRGGRARLVAEDLGITIRNVYDRRAKIENKLHISLPSGGLGGRNGRGDAGNPAFLGYNYNPRMHVSGFLGRAVIFSDAHWWPGLSDTLAFKALIEVIKETKPKLVIGNGDLLDGARISRFGRSDWSETPKMLDELEEVKAKCATIRHAYRGARLIRTVGNHDQRFDKYLAQHAGEMEGIEGFRLSDHLKEWEETTSVWINGHTVVKHRWHGGIHGAWQNVLKSGVTMITGHTHTLLCRPFVDYRGRRYGIEDGTLAEPGGAPFAYAEDNPSQGCSGFVSVTFAADGTIQYPQLCEIKDGVAYYRDEVVLRERQKAA